MFSLAETLLGFYQLKTLIEESKGWTHVVINDLTLVAFAVKAECFTSESKLSEFEIPKELEQVAATVKLVQLEF